MARKRKPKPSPTQQEAEEQALREERLQERIDRENGLIRSAGWVRPEDLETQADRILMDGQAKLLEEVAALRESYKQLTLPSNDPEYLAKLTNTEKTRAEIANKVTAVHIVPDPQDIGRKWISLGLVDPRNPGEALETARQLGEHLEAKVINHESGQ